MAVTSSTSILARIIAFGFMPPPHGHNRGAAVHAALALRLRSMPGASATAPSSRPTSDGSACRTVIGNRVAHPAVIRITGWLAAGFGTCPASETMTCAHQRSGNSLPSSSQVSGSHTAAVRTIAGWGAPGACRAGVLAPVLSTELAFGRLASPDRAALDAQLRPEPSVGFL